MEQIRTVDTWKRIGKTYRCGCCGKIPVFVDIRDLKVCPNCRHQMLWYENEDGEIESLFQNSDYIPECAWMEEGVYELDGFGHSKGISGTFNEPDHLFSGSRVG